jgi:hypothetical protein
LQKFIDHNIKLTAHLKYLRIAINVKDSFIQSGENDGNSKLGIKEREKQKEKSKHSELKFQKSFKNVFPGRWRFCLTGH